MDIRDGERLDEIGFGGLKLIQKPQDFCYGVDAVLLADFAASIAKKKLAIIDLGTGTGIIPVILSHKTSAEKICGVEIQQDSYERAIRNVRLNGLDDRLEMICCNVKNLDESLKGCFDTATSNPPYMEQGSAIVNDISAKTIARHEVYAGLEDFIAAAAFLLEERGEFFMVHRPSRLVDIMYYSRQYRLEPKTVRFVCPKSGQAANIVLIHCIKNAGRELRLLPDLYVYNGDGSYTDEIQQIYERV